MRYPHRAGVDDRIRERLDALGKTKAAFIREHHYDPRNFYAWLGGRTPSDEYLRKLAADLQCSVAWLSFGEEAVAPSKKRVRRVLTCLVAALLGLNAWGAAEAQPLRDAPSLLDRAASYRKRLRRIWHGLTNRVSPAVGVSPIDVRNCPLVYRYVAMA